MSDEFIIFTENYQSWGRSVSDVVRGLQSLVGLLVASLPRQDASLLQTATFLATPVGTASFFINANVH